MYSLFRPRLTFSATNQPEPEQNQNNVLHCTNGTMQGGRYRAVAHLPTSIIGWVIGHKGCNARMLKQQTGTELWVDVPGQVCQNFDMIVPESPAWSYILYQGAKG